jgi:hypothetical protein
MSIDILKKTLITWLAIFGVTSCRTHAHEFVVDGVPGKFCVPEENIPEDVWWVPRDAPNTPRGFSFLGCTTSKASVVSDCSLPKQLVSADVEPNNSARIQSWRNLKSSALFVALSNDPATNYEIDVPTGLLVVSNMRIWKEWFIWHRANSQTGGEIRPTDQDTLVASCSNMADFPNSSGSGFKGNYGCRRYASGPAFSVRYRFVSESRIPSGPESLDNTLFDQIKTWQCNIK